VVGLPVTLHEITWDGGIGWDDAVALLEEWKRRNIAQREADTMKEEDGEGEGGKKKEEEGDHMAAPELSKDSRLTGFFR